MEKKLNIYKVIALILLVIEVYIAFGLDKNLVKESINTWRLYAICIMFIPVNVLFITTKQKRIIKK